MLLRPAIVFFACLHSVAASAATGYSLTNAFPNVSFGNPVCIASAPGETNRLFVLEKLGVIAVITNLAAPNVSLFMDLTDRVTSPSDPDEQGLLGLAFHPGFATNGFFYVFYTGPATTSAGTGRHDILSRFHISDSNPNRGDRASEVRYIVQWDRASNHNAGDLHFGPDDYLYVALGDEGGAYGQFGNTQKIDLNFFSAIMRIDVDNRPGSLPPNPHSSALASLTNYSIPPDNYFVGATNFNGLPVDPANVRTEFWAVGMRNPWRFSFDPFTGICYVGHVGQTNIEWINIATNGANCGWNYYEGGKQWTNAPPPGFVLTPPLWEYGHTNSRACIIGGVVYRGSQIPQLNGAYIYGDYSSGEIWALRHSGMTVTDNSLLLKSTKARFSAFGIDPSNGDILGAPFPFSSWPPLQRLVYTNKLSTPVFTEVYLSGASLFLNGTGGRANQTYRLVSSTNIEPSSVWSALATGVFDGNGAFSITNPIDPDASQSFYRVQLP
jgi:glucose/arabinose dehydrogenase